jgi:tRNA-specific 2-thiouridylase
MLPKLLFPVGDLTKDEVRDQARALALATAEKPESQEICFVPTGDYRDLLQKRLNATHPALTPGNLVNRAGDILGQHTGYAGFTVGQRKGFGGGFPEAMFVLAVRAETREVVIGTREELFSDQVDIAELNWLEEPPEPGQSVRVQLRYRAPDVAARVTSLGDVLSLDLDEDFAAVTPGQSAVVFDCERVLGGGRIVRSGLRSGSVVSA